jgi:hypothetical protein
LPRSVEIDGTGSLDALISTQDNRDQHTACVDFDATAPTVALISCNAHWRF